MDAASILVAGQVSPLRGSPTLRFRIPWTYARGYYLPPLRGFGNGDRVQSFPRLTPWAQGLRRSAAAGIRHVTAAPGSRILGGCVLAAKTQLAGEQIRRGE